MRHETRWANNSTVARLVRQTVGGTKTCQCETEKMGKMGFDCRPLTGSGKRVFMDKYAKYEVG